MLSEAFASVLRSGRADFNAQFAAARRQYPELDSEAFGAFLESCVDRWVSATGLVRPERVADVAMAAYEVSLALVGQRIAGPTARTPFVGEGLHRVLPAAAVVVADDPLRAMGALANALHQLACTPGARAADFTDNMERMAPLASTVPELLALGQVVAWRSGLAHYRASALAVADGLPQGLALVAVGASASDSWSTIRARLLEDPWFVPGGNVPPTRVALCTGAFRGFGGLFIAPPYVLWSGDHLLVRSGDDAWLLVADAFGATFHRASAEEVSVAKPQNQLPPGLRVAGGALAWRGQSLPLPTVGAITSAACSATTLALTSELSHAVVLVALGAPA